MVDPKAATVYREGDPSVATADKSAAEASWLRAKCWAEAAAGSMAAVCWSGAEVSFLPPVEEVEEVVLRPAVRNHIQADKEEGTTSNEEDVLAGADVYREGHAICSNRNPTPTTNRRRFESKPIGNIGRPTGLHPPRWG